MKMHKPVRQHVPRKTLLQSGFQLLFVQLTGVEAPYPVLCLIMQHTALLPVRQRPERRLHLAKLHAVAHVLDLVVPASKHHQLSVRQEISHVAAAVEPLLPAPVQRINDPRTLRSLRVTVIAGGDHRAGHQHLGRLARLRLVSVLIHKENMDDGKRLAHGQTVARLMLSLNLAHRHGEHLRAAVKVPPVRIRRGVHPCLEWQPGHGFAAHNAPFQVGHGPRRQHARVHHTDKAGGRHAKLADVMLVQAGDHALWEGQHTGGQQIGPCAQRHRRENIQNGVGVEEGRLVAEHHVLRKAVHLDGRLHPVDVAEVRLDGALGDSRRAGGVENGHRVVHAGLTANGCKPRIVGPGGRGCGVVNYREAVKPAGRKRTGAPLIHQHGGGLHELQQQPESLGRHGNIQRGICAARVDRAKNGRDVADTAAVQQQRHRRSRSSDGSKAGADAPCALPQRGKGQAILIVIEGDPLRDALHGALQIIQHIGFHWVFAPSFFSGMYMGYCAYHCAALSA